MDSENQYQILLYADTTENRTNSVPLGTTWYPIDTVSLHDKVGVKKIPIQVSVHIDDIGRIHEYIMENTFLMLPFEIPDYETEIYLVQGSNVRIIKDKAHNDCNIRYFTGVVKSVQNNAIDSKKVYTVELDHFTKNKRIEVTKIYLELLDNKNSLKTYFTYIKTNKKQLSTQKYEKSKQYRTRMKHRSQANLECSKMDKFLMSSTLYQAYRYYLKHAVVEKIAVSNFLICSEDGKVFIDIPADCLDIDPFTEPKPKKHIMDEIVKVCSDACQQISLRLVHTVTIRSNWPPSLGDTVHILEGLYKGETGIIEDIQYGIGNSIHGEAVVHIIGKFEKKTETKKKVKAMDKKPLKKVKKATTKSTQKNLHTITMNYLSLVIETDELPLTEYIFYPGSIRYTIEFEPSADSLFQYRISTPDKNEIMDLGRNSISQGDYVYIDNDTYRGYVGQVCQGVDCVQFKEFIPKGVRDAEVAGEPMIMVDDSEDTIRRGLQYFLDVRLANDLYRLAKPDSNVSTLNDVMMKLFYSPKVGCQSECSRLNGLEDAMKIVRGKPLSDIEMTKTGLNRLVDLMDESSSDE